jgi:SAM-dependent methyltransferase
MSLDRHKEDWERLAEVDPLWAVLTAPEQKDGGWNTDAFFATGEEEIAGVFSEVERLGRTPGRARALDFGCGVGRLTRALGTRFETAVGVDISEAMVEQARRLNEAFPACDFRINTTADLSQFETGSFDFIYSSLVLQHLPSVAHVEGYVAEFLRLVRPEGLVVFGIPRHISFPYSLQPRRRVYGLLRRFGVSEEWMLRRTPLTPMRMTVVTEEAVRKLVEGQGGIVLQAEPIDAGPVRALRYYVAPSER